MRSRCAESPHLGGPHPQPSTSTPGTLSGMTGSPTPVAQRPRSRGRELAGPLATFAVVAVSWAAVAALRPGDAGPTPCPWRNLTGLDCPFCGSTRAAVALANGDVLAAVDHNALFVLGVLPLAFLAWGVWLVSAARGRATPIVSTRLVWVLVALTLGWWVLRLAVPWLGSSAG